MNLFRSNTPPSRVPTLTEVVDLVPIEAHEATAAQPEAAGQEALQASKARTDVIAEEATAPLPVTAPVPLAAPHLPPPGADLPSHDELVRQIMGDIQRQIDAMLEVRMKETLAPAITRFTDALARDTRAELGGVLKDVVTRAVTQALTKHRAK